MNLQALVARPFQDEAIEEGLKGSKIFWIEPGLGKTFISAELGKKLAKLFKNTPPLFLVIGKKEPTVRLQWKETILRQDPTARVEIIESPEQFRDYPRYKGSTPIWIYVHYDFFRKHHDFFNGCRWLAVFVDEAHRLGNKDNKISIAVRSLRFVHRKYALTGTAIDKHAGELWSLLNWISPAKFKKYWDFDKKFVDRIQTYGDYTKIRGTKNYDEFARVIEPYVFKRTKEEVAEQMPELNEQVIKIKLSTEHRKVYDQVRKAKDAIVQIGEDYHLINNQLKRAIRLQQLASNPELLEVKLKDLEAKFKYAQEYIEDNEGEQCIVFTTFAASALKMAKLVGGVFAHPKNPNLQRDIAYFKAGKRQVLVGTIDYLGEALDLKNATTAIFVELDRTRSSKKMSQAINRIHRIGIKEGKQALYLLADNTIDLLIMKSIKEKWTDQDFINEAVREGYL